LAPVQAILGGTRGGDELHLGLRSDEAGPVIDPGGGEGKGRLDRVQA